MASQAKVLDLHLEQKVDHFNCLQAYQIFASAKNKN
jgi:hypothetical protein